MPGLLGPDGYPLSWRHYIYGLQYIHRAHARESLRSATAASIATHADKDQWAQWRSLQNQQAGW